MEQDHGRQPEFAYSFVSEISSIGCLPSKNVHRHAPVRVWHANAMVLTIARDQCRIRAALPHLLKSPSARIVNIASTEAFLGTANLISCKGQFEWLSSSKIYNGGVVHALFGLYRYCIETRRGRLVKGTGC